MSRSPKQKFQCLSTRSPIKCIHQGLWVCERRGSKITAALYIIFFTLLSFGGYAQYASIPLDEKGRLESPDLVPTKNKEPGLWNPAENTLWSDNFPELTEKMDELPVQNGESVEFLSSLKSKDIFRFSALRNDNSTQVFYLDKTLHTTLLRKNLLRKLGFYIPPMKYLKKLTVRFKDLAQKSEFIERMRRDAVGNEDRWIVQNEEDSLKLTLRDLAAVEAGVGVPYNLAMGVPSGDGSTGDALNSRVLRSVLLVYSLLDLEESINKFAWRVGRVDGPYLKLPHFFHETNNFSSTNINDLRWLAERLTQLTRKDFQQVADAAFIPKDVRSIFLQKLFSRIEGLLEVLQTPLPAAFRQEIQYTTHPKGKYITDGELTKKDWSDQGYATRFASDIKPGPFQDLGYFFLSQLQSVALSNAVGRFNEQLKAFDPNDARVNLQEKEFYEGLVEYQKTGIFKPFPVSTWVSPLLEGNLILSRDIIVGNYLGTDSKIQLADTFGYHITPGVMLGVENLNAFDQVNFQFGVNYVKTYTHLKPINSMKQVFKEDYRNLIVPLLLKKLRKRLTQFRVDQNNSQTEVDPAVELEKEAQYFGDLIKEINNTIGVGESLILMERLQPALGGQVTVPMMAAGIDLSIGVNASHLSLKRIHIQRTSADVIEIYEDKGAAKSLRVSLELKKLIPIIRIEREVKKGGFDLDSFALNFNVDPRRNRSFRDNAQALEQLLFKGKTELLEQNRKSQVKAKFSDSYARDGFLFWRSRRIKGFTKYEVKTPIGVNGNFVSYYSGKDEGRNYESFFKDLINYQLADFSKDLEWENQVWKRSSDSILGKGKITEYNYEAQIENERETHEYMLLAKSYKGWSKSNKKLKKLIKKINKDYNASLFEEGLIRDIKTLKLYNIEVKIHLYDEALESLKAASPDMLRRLAAHLTPGAHGLNKAIHHKSKFDESTTLKTRAKHLTLYIKELYRSLDFALFSKLLGDKFYLEGGVEGFRKDSEVHILEDDNAIEANAFGRQDPNYPQGLLQSVLEQLMMSEGEFSGYWLRDRL